MRVTELLLVATAVACLLAAAAQPTDPDAAPFAMPAGAMAHLRTLAVNVGAGNGTQDAQRAAAAGFVVRDGTHFQLHGAPFHFVGGEMTSARTHTHTHRHTHTHVRTNVLA